MDKELSDLASEFRLDRYNQIYMRIFLLDTWILLRGYGDHMQYWSKEEREWQSGGDANQDKYLFETPEEAFEYYKQHLRIPKAW